MKKFLESGTHYLEGPSSRGSELKFIIKSSWQMFQGIRRMHFIGPCITVFGSARTEESDPDYTLAMEVGKRIAGLGFTTLTGGGPGIMEAANRGAYEQGGNSVGCTIKLPMEQSSNPYLHKSIDFDYFFVRKVLLLKYSYAFVVLPGGYGTLDEFFETLTLIQTGIIHNFPVVLMGCEYYQPVEEMIQKMIEEETISPQDRQLIKRTDDIDQAILHIQNYIGQNYKIKAKKLKTFWWLGE